MSLLIDPYRFAAPATWDATVAALAPWAWLKLDDATTGTTAADSSGNGRNGSYPNGALSGFPVRHSAALPTGSVWGIVTGGGGNLELTGPSYGSGLTGSFTFGAWMKSTSNTTAQYLWNVGGFPLSVSFNFDFVTSFGNDPGTISFAFDTGGAQANALAAIHCGWNDGSKHLILVEYDSVADTISIWKDGVRIATKARGGTKPSPSGSTLSILYNNNISGMGMDEFLLFNKVLTSGEHTALAAF